MERRDIVKYSERLTFWIIILSIVGLVFISIIPWISISEMDEVKEDLVFNLEMMKRSDNQAINDIASQIELINFLLWSLIILGLISLIGATIHSSGKFLIMGQVLLMVSCVMVISSIFTLHVHLSVYTSIEEHLIISSVDLIPHIKYSFILLIINIVIFICSAVYVVLMIFHLVDSIKKFLKSKKETNQIPNNIEHNEPVNVVDEKDLELNKVFSEKIKNMDDQNEQRSIINQNNDNSAKPKGNIKSPFKDKKTLENEAEEQIKDSKSNNIISEKSDIMPKEKDIDKIPSDLKIQQKGIPLTVRCPKCRYIFPIEKKRNEIKIECPKCGKTGTLKT